MFQVMPITETKIDWNNYLITLQKILQRSVTIQLDKHNMRPDNLAAYIVTLGTVLDSNLKPNEILSEGGSLLQHGSFGFLAILDTELLLEIIQTSDLHCTSIPSQTKNIRLAILTGTLEQWRTSIINMCSPTADYELRAIFDMCMLHMEKSGLAPLWWNYQKHNLSDKTFALLEKQ